MERLVQVSLLFTYFFPKSFFLYGLSFNIFFLSTFYFLQDLCKCSEHYADKIFALLAQAGFYDDTLTFSEGMVDQVLATSTFQLHFSTSDYGFQMCVTVNNAEHVNEIIIELPRKLRLKDFRQKLAVAQVS